MEPSAKPKSKAARKPEMSGSIGATHFDGGETLKFECADALNLGASGKLFARPWAELGRARASRARGSILENGPQN